MKQRAWKKKLSPRQFEKLILLNRLAQGANRGNTSDREKLESLLRYDPVAIELAGLLTRTEQRKKSYGKKGGKKLKAYGYVMKGLYGSTRPGTWSKTK